MSKRRLLQLKRNLKAAGITHDRVAAVAGVTRTMVVNVLAGRTVSESNVVATIKRLLAERETAVVA